MNIDFDFVKWIGALALAGAGWLWRELQKTREGQSRDRDEFATYKVYVAEHYVPKTELMQMRQEWIDRLDRIENKIDRLAAK